VVQSIDRFPFYLNRALRAAISGRPGPVVLQVPADVLEAVIKPNQFQHIPFFPSPYLHSITAPAPPPAPALCPPITASTATAATTASAAANVSGTMSSALIGGGLNELLVAATHLLCSAQRPLLVIGKGCAFSRAEHELNTFQTLTALPFIPCPMAKGMVCDSHRRNASAARTHALAQADCIVLIAARLNWMLHYGSVRTTPSHLSLSMLCCEL
jgi:thiamine pyrophosphate-dependent acetolactate synthase large subunit-like protein